MLAAGSKSGLFNWVVAALGTGYFPYIGTFFLLFFAGWLLPLPEEPTVIAAGYVTAKNGLNMPLMLVCILFGIQCGDLVIFWIGRRHGDWIFKLRFLRWLLPEERLAKARRLFAEHGSKMAFFGRFIMGVRIVVFFTAGNLGVPVTTFIFFDFLATLLTIPIGFFLGWKFSDKIDLAFEYMRQSHWYVLGFVGLLGLVIFIHHWIQSRATRRFNETSGAAQPPAATTPTAPEKESANA